MDKTAYFKLPTLFQPEIYEPLNVDINKCFLNFQKSLKHEMIY